MSNSIINNDIKDNKDNKVNSIGVVGEETTTKSCEIICESKVNYGEYVIVKNMDNENVLGIVKFIGTKNNKILCGVSIVGVLNELETKTDIKPNRSPIQPNSLATLCNEKSLSKLYYDSKGLNIGNLLTRTDVRAYLNVNKLMSRHFAILSITGGGKSNTVAVICKELAKINGTAIIFDPHGEYMSMKHDIMENKLNPLKAKLDPSIMSPGEFAELIGLTETHNKERVFLNMAYNTLKKQGEEKRESYRGKVFIDLISKLIVEWLNISVAGWEMKYYNNIKHKYENRKLDKEDTDILNNLLDSFNKFESLFSVYITNEDIMESFQKGKLNIVELSGFEVNQMIALVSYVSKQTLNKRIAYKNALRDLYHYDEKIRSRAIKTKYEIESKFPVITKPVVIIVEEAHIYIPVNKETEASLWLSKIAREGRKFGVGLGIVTQQPKKINENVLSQTNTKIILKIVEPEDQKYIQKASEDLGEDLLNDLASLGIGEAVISGNAIALPAIVKIDKFDGSYGGEDIDIYNEWRDY